ncbi:MAG: PilT/PilU family type 4a pilus ATPase, partial [Planctomycetaceae bacterium]|nr:PilT/PilU family type 4a pilus ATPase [Planctomycetaceae bacterium]
MWKIKDILEHAKLFHASDVHLVHRVAPILRIHGEIRQIKGEQLTREDLHSLLHEIASPRQIEHFEQKQQLCFSTTFEGVGRVRVSVYYQALIPEMSIRVCETRIRTLEELGLPQVLEDFARYPYGLVLVTGPTGTGKTTTLNVMVDIINQEQRKKIVMIEDPVEFVHHNSKSIVIQQEVLTDIPTFQEALVGVLRQDPDVIVIGEMRSLETIETALTAAETGHLVIATLHTPDSVQSIQRIQTVFPAAQQNLINMQLANSLQAVISQRLLPRADGKGRALAYEVCIVNYAIRNKIR